MAEQIVEKIALVTGANRGIGFQVATDLTERGFLVLLGCRDPENGEKSAKFLRSKGGKVDVIPLDMSDTRSIEGAAMLIKRQYGRVDVLVNNAGILKDKAGTITDTPILLATLTTNTIGPFLLTQKIAPLMPKSGRVINVSSGMGQLSEMGGGYAAYRISKTGLNAVTKVFAAELREAGILVNSVCPGWVKTDMGGEGADRSLKKGAETIVWLATEPGLKKSGSFFRDKTEIPW